MQRSFSILDVALHVEAPEAALAPIAEAYARFEGTAGRPLSIAMDDARLRIGDDAYLLLSGVDPTHQLYSRMLTALMREIESHAVLHAAALVCPDGKALVIAGPSGFGKSSLARELASRGFGFLSDDYAPLDLDAGTIAPYPRAMAIRTDSPHDGPTLLGKRLVHADPLATEPAPLGRVAILDGFGPPAATQIEIGVAVGDAAALDRALERIAGVRSLGVGGSGELATRRIVVDPAARSTPELARVLEGEAVLFSEKLWSRRPDFGAPPRSEPISTRDAATRLGREILNARRDGRLLARHSGDPVALFLALGGALAGVECVRLRPGPFEATAELLERVAKA